MRGAVTVVWSARCLSGCGWAVPTEAEPAPLTAGQAASAAERHTKAEVHACAIEGYPAATDRMPSRPASVLPMAEQ
jgi:hypothetical protein